MQNTPITHLSTYHDLRAIDIARGFVAQTGGFFGANKQEMHQLELIAEEASAFIINALHPDKDKLFEIKAKPIDSGLSFYFYSKGEPIDEESLPVYDSLDPENSSEGLEFFLLESLSDAMEFKNEGNDGWVLVFEKRFRNFKPFIAQEPIDEEIINKCAKEKLSFSIATPNDAYGIVKLTYLTYRYSYGRSVFYYRTQLQKAIEKKEIIVFIAKNAKNEVAVCSTYYRSSECPHIVESGMLMSQPKYRKNPALLRLTRNQVKFLKENQEGLYVAYTNLVTAHTGSQRLVSHYDYHPTALKLSVHDRVDFVGIQTKKEERESLVYALSIQYDLEETTIFLPKQHHKITKSILEHYQFITLSCEEQHPTDTTTQIKVEKHQEQRNATLHVNSFGKKWQEELKTALKELKSDGIITMFVYIKADEKLPVDFEKTMVELGLFYSGVVIKTLKTWELLYTALEAQRFEFDSMELSDPKAIELKEYIRKLV